MCKYCLIIDINGLKILYQIYSGLDIICMFGVRGSTHKGLRPSDICMPPINRLKKSAGSFSGVGYFFSRRFCTFTAIIGEREGKKATDNRKER